MQKMFAKVWLVAMGTGGLVAAGLTSGTDSSWVDFAFALVLVGVLTWAVWGIVCLVMPWITEE